MDWYQKEINLKSRVKGFHLVTDEVIDQIPEMKKIKTGLMHIFIKHTSASLAINENYDPDVRGDFERYFSRIVKENEPWYEHNSEGSDDMPAHIKSTIIGSSLIIPITNGQLNLGTWQGIYLCEHRNHAGSRKIVVTINGDEPD